MTISLKLVKTEIKYPLFSKFLVFSKYALQFASKTQGVATLKKGNCNCSSASASLVFAGATVSTKLSFLSYQALETTDSFYNTNTFKMRPSTYRFIKNYDLLGAPKDILDAKCNHIGSLDVDDANVIYTPWEDGNSYLNPAIVGYNTDLKYSFYAFLSTDILNDGAPYCAVDNGFLYITKYNLPTDLLIFETKNLMKNNKDKVNPDKVIPIDQSEVSKKIDHVQAAKIYKGNLYLLDDREKIKRIYCMDIKTGKVSKDIINFNPLNENGTDEIKVEAESFTFFEEDSKVKMLLIGNYEKSTFSRSIVFYTFDVIE